MKKILSFSLIVFIIVSILGTWQGAQASPLSRGGWGTASMKIAPSVSTALAALQPGNMLTVIVTLKDQADLSSLSPENSQSRQLAVIAALQIHARASQRSISTLLEAGKAQGRVSQVIPFWVFNGLSVTATADMIQELASRSDVDSIMPDAIDIVPVGRQDLAAPADNLFVINAPALWSLGFYGQGVVVANLDTGVDASHPDLSSRWRGGSNSWYDPYNQHPTTPTDLNGHGTWTMGVMVAGDASGATLGVAPQAQWIAAKIFNDSGSATATAIHLAFQWVLNPDGDVNTADAPQVVNNSWAYGSPGCNLAFQNDLRSLRNAGILPVFAAGNYGPNASTSVSPANYPEAFAVGAVDNNGNLDNSSSRGPSACGETSTIYPELVAPGVSITTPGLFGSYTANTGTSLSSPHVAGALALLLGAFPGLNVETQSTALLNTAVDLGSAGPDNNFGYGRIDVLSAYNWLAAGNRVSPTPTSTPTPQPTATATPVPTATPTQSPYLFADGFESGNFSAWSASATNGGSLSVTSAAALSGTKGMQATINNTTAMYVQDNSPAAELTYHARFYFAPNTASLSSGKYHDIFIGRNSSGTVIFHVQFGRTSTGLAVRLLARSNNSEASTAWIGLNPGSNGIEIYWKASSTSSGTNGSGELYVNGSLAATLSGLANGKYSLEDVRLGPQSLAKGISGTEYFDAFASSRSSYIGP